MDHIATCHIETGKEYLFDLQYFCRYFIYLLEKHFQILDTGDFDSALTVLTEMSYLAKERGGA